MAMKDSKPALLCELLNLIFKLGNCNSAKLVKCYLKRVTARCHTFVACLTSYSGVLLIYALFADISWLFQHVTGKFENLTQLDKEVFKVLKKIKCSMDLK